MKLLERPLFPMRLHYMLSSGFCVPPYNVDRSKRDFGRVVELSVVIVSEGPYLGPDAVQACKVFSGLYISFQVLSGCQLH